MNIALCYENVNPARGGCETYIADLGVDLLDNAPIFRTAGSGTGPKGGRRWLPQPYSTSKMDRDFREIRWEVFGQEEHRQLADMRRSGAVEGDAGEGAMGERVAEERHAIADDEAPHAAADQAGEQNRQSGVDIE